MAMKNLLYLTLLLLCTACARQYQSVTIASNQVTLRDDGQFVFENDTVRILYDFHSLNGEMKFSIFNKLPKPIYVNWKESAFIIGPHFSTYWLDQYVSNGYVYQKFFDWDGYINLRGPYLFSVAKRDEQTSFIPPNAGLMQFEFVVKPGTAYGPTYVNQTHLDKNQPQKKVKQYQYTPENTPTFFRNFLTFSTDEMGTQKFVLDQQFWVSTIIQGSGKALFGPGFDPIIGINPMLRRPPARKSDITGYNRFILKTASDGTTTPMIQTTPVRQSVTPVDVSKQGNQ